MSEADEKQAQGYFLHALPEIQRVLPCHKSLDSWMENGAIRLESKNMGPWMWLAHLSAVYTIEQPFANWSVTVAAWVQENDPFREKFNDPEYAVNDERDLEIQLAFTEPLRLIERAAHPLERQTLERGPL
ncbi:hypothetical protein R5M74_02360 [Aeromonas hydrophila]|nr:hypothetical protein R5M74_02360 [Aeromonas hydrophila]